MNKLEILQKTWAGENCAINNITKSIAHKKRHFLAQHIYKHITKNRLDNSSYFLISLLRGETLVLWISRSIHVLDL